MIGGESTFPLSQIEIVRFIVFSGDGSIEEYQGGGIKVAIPKVVLGTNYNGDTCCKGARCGDYLGLRVQAMAMA